MRVRKELMARRGRRVTQALKALLRRHPALKVHKGGVVPKVCREPLPPSPARKALWAALVRRVRKVLQV